MAKYQVTFSCGHTSTVELVGKTSERERRILWYEQSGICPDCYKAQQEAKRTAAIDVCKDLPQLVGSPKQIAWAEKIRAEKYNMFNGKDFDIVSGETSAVWWIEHRDNVETEIFKRSRQTQVDALANMSKSEIFRRAHMAARKVKTTYPDVDYSATFAICIKELYAALKALKANKIA